MDKNSPIDRKWKLCACASFIGCFILTFSLNTHHNSETFVTFRNILVTVTPSQSSDPSLFVEKEEPRNKNASLTIDNEKHISRNTGQVFKPSISSESMDQTLFVENKKPLNKSTTLVIQNKEPVNRNADKCNIFDGRWIYKPVNTTLYDRFQCPFLSNQVSCQKNGRPDFAYESWSWESRDCEIPRFDGKELLERLRGKRVVIVGDSLNRNQWESLACLLYSVIPPSRAHVEVQSGVYKVLKAKDYNCSVEFHWSPFLVELDTNQPNGTKVLRLDKLANSAQQWRGADIMVFNTGHWWTHTGKFRAWDLFQYKGKLARDMDTESAFEKAMNTWAQWIDQNVDSTKTTVFFRSISPEHKGENWCYNVTQPIMDESYKALFPKPLIQIVERTIGGMRTPVGYLNITKLSEYRRDAHPAVYTTKKGKITDKKGKRQESFTDCSHWCLPGLPDTWNRMFYTLLVFNTSRNSFNSTYEVS